MNESSLDYIKRRAAENADEIRRNPQLESELEERIERSHAIIAEAEQMRLAPRKVKARGAGNTVHFADEKDV